MAKQPLTATAEAQKSNINKKHDDLVALLKDTLAIGDYEDLFFNFLEAMHSKTHWAMYDNYLFVLLNTYDALIEENYTA